MALSDQEVLDPAGGAKQVAPMNADDLAPTKKFASRDDWLNAVGKLREEEHEVEGLGLLLLSEVTGEVRAEIMSDQSAVLLLPEGQTRKLDQRGYQKKLILAGVVDPESPPGDRNPLFKAGDLDRVMKIGGGKVAEVVDRIERLSGLGQYQAAAEKNSDKASGAGTSK